MRPDRTLKIKINPGIRHSASGGFGGEETVKVVLFCGGLGTRLREHSSTIPKSLVPIGQRPIILHLMHYYAHFGHCDFILCLGYKGDLIKEFFLNYDWRTYADFTLGGEQERDEKPLGAIDDWRIRFIDTGLHSNIGQRLTRVREYLEGEEVFLANYSDQLSDFHLPDMVELQRNRGAIACFLSVRPSQTFHTVDVDLSSGKVRGFGDVRHSDMWINGGYMVLRRDIFDYINEGEELVEQPFERLMAIDQLYSIRHEGFWAAMDTFKDKIGFDRMDGRGEQPWQVWS